MATVSHPLRVGAQIGQVHVTWQQTRQAWLYADDLGVDSIFNADHFFPLSGDSDGSFFEAWSIVAAMAEATSRADIGVLVSGNSYRNPNLLADMARTVDHISGGRAILGIGSGWTERDYVEYGYEFGTAASRLQDLARDLPIIRARLDALNPGPVRGHLPIMIGGAGEKVTLRLVAEHATIWHCLGDLDEITRKSAVLDEWCVRIGRDPNTIERSANISSDEVGNADAFADAGFTHLIHALGGPTYDFAPVEALVAWRDGRNAAIGTG